MQKFAMAVSVLVLAAACERSSLTPLPTSPSLDRTAASGGRANADTLRHRMVTRRGFGGTLSNTGNMTFHSGNVMPSNVTYAIFWSAKWNDQSFVGDKITGLTSFFQGLGGSKWLNVLREYPDNVNQMTTHSTWMTYYIDASSEPPAGDPGTGGAQNEICSVLNAHGVSPRTDAIYVLYDTATSQSFGYDGWHSYGTCGADTIRFAVVFNTDWYNRTGDPGTYHSIHTDNLADITAHEVAETINDPLITSWWAQQAPNGEVGDKCNGSYNPTAPYVTLSNGSQWKIQGLWSNAANNANSGFANGNGELGCITHSDVVLGSFSVSGSLSGSAPVTTWTVPTVSNGDASDTRYTVYRSTSVGGTYVDENDPIATNYQGTEYLDLSRTVVGYNGTSNPGPHYDWVSYYIVASNGQTNQQTLTVYFKCGAFGKGCGQ